MRAWQREERARRLGLATSIGASRARLDELGWNEPMRMYREADRDGLAAFARQHRFAFDALYGALQLAWASEGWTLQEQDRAWDEATRRRWAARGLGEQYDRIFASKERQL